MSLNQYTKRGFSWGLLATLAMTIVMGLGMASGKAPMPDPIPIAIMKQLLGEVPQPVLMATGLIAHFLYGGIFGAILGTLFEGQIKVWHGLVLGILLWVVMQVIVLPVIGWGIFGSGVTPKIAVATLVLHLVYGGVVGWGLRGTAKGWTRESGATEGR